MDWSDNARRVKRPEFYRYMLWINLMQLISHFPIPKLVVTLPRKAS